MDRMLSEVMNCLQSMPRAEYFMTEDMLKTYCWASVHLKELTDKVNCEGALLYGSGGARENPAIATIAKLASKKSDYYTKIMKMLDKNAQDAMSSLDAFLEG